MKKLNRIRYLNQLIDLQNTSDIKVITGIRRSGKSTLLCDFIKYLKNNDKNANIIFINLQDLEFEELLNYHTLNKYITGKFIKNKHNVLLIDEIQLCNKFELAINSLHAKGLFDIYITSSNAFLLSSDLATLFTGRTVSIEIFPFSFNEFLQYYDSVEDYEKELDNYLRFGGMPGALEFKKSAQKYNYVNSVYNTILIRDLVDKYKIRNKSELVNISKFMIDNIGNVLSPNSICNAYKNSKNLITRKTVSKYISYLENSFLFYRAKRYDLAGKRYLETIDKYYLSDHAFKYSINGTKNMDYGRSYENMVYIELLRRGYQVYVGKLYKKEIDFVAIKKDEKLYIQVSDNIDQSKTFEREVKPLLSIHDAYPKIIIARTHHPEYYYEGVKVIDIAKWLADTKHMDIQ